jgi:hypothetical protein
MSTHRKTSRAHQPNSPSSRNKLRSISENNIAEKTIPMGQRTTRTWSRSKLRDAHRIQAAKWRRLYRIVTPLVVAGIAFLFVQHWTVPHWLSLIWRIPLVIVLAVLPTILHDRYIHHLRQANALDQQPAEKILTKYVLKTSPRPLIIANQFDRSKITRIAGRLCPQRRYRRV